MIINTSRTVRYKNIRILLTIAAIFNLEVWQQNVLQSYIEEQDMERDIYVKPAPQFKLGQGMLRKQLNILYTLRIVWIWWFLFS